MIHSSKTQILLKKGTWWPDGRDIFYYVVWFSNDFLVMSYTSQLPLDIITMGFAEIRPNQVGY